MDINNIPEEIRNNIDTNKLNKIAENNPVVNENEIENEISSIEDQIINSESSSYSAVLGNLDDDKPVSTNEVKTVEPEDIEFEKVEIKDEPKKEEIEFSYESNTGSAEEAFTKETIEKEKKDEKTFSKSFKDVKVTTKRSNFLDNIKVDLNNIVLTEVSPLKQTNNMNFIFGSGTTPTFPIVCCQSSYSALMSGLTISEKNAVSNPNLDQFQSRNVLYTTIYNKIQSMNIEKPSYNDWLKITSFGDLNSLLFGIYCQTFTDNNDFDITCGKCEKTTSITVDNNSLIEVKDKEVFGKIDEIVSSIKTGEELIQHSLVHKIHRVMLDDSKIIVDIHTPSLYDHLKLLKEAKMDVVRKYADTFSAMLFIQHLYVLDVESTKLTGNPSYYEVTAKSKILDILLNLTTNDGDQLEEFIDDKLSRYRIQYEISNVKCSHCKSEIPNISIDIERILFTRLSRRTKKQED